MVEARRGGVGRLLRQVRGDDWLSTAVDRAIQRRAERPAWATPDARIHPSASGSPCARAIQIGMLGHREPVTPKLQRVFDVGHSGQERWMGYLRDAGLHVEESLRERDDDWSGELDVIVRHPVIDRRHVLELKTMNSHRYRRIPAADPDPVRNAYRLWEAERGYTGQLVQYLVRFQESRGLDDVAILLVEDKESQDYLVRYIQPDVRLRELVFQVPMEAQRATWEGRLIDPPFRRMSPTCRACRKEEVCYGLRDGDLDVTERVERALKELKR